MDDILAQMMKESKPEFVPAEVAGAPEGGIEIRVTALEWEVALLWAERTARAPGRPVLLAMVFPGESEYQAGLRTTARRLWNKGVLLRRGRGFVMYEPARKFVNEWRDRDERAS